MGLLRAFRLLLLATSLLVAQQVGLAHELGHATRHGSTHQHGKGLPTQVCDECLAFSHVESGSPAGFALPVCDAPSAVPARALAAGMPGRFFRLFEPRGPPILA
jgi:hypothetical protein